MIVIKTKLIEKIIVFAIFLHLIFGIVICYGQRPGVRRGTHVQKGIALFKRGQLDLAMKEFNSALRINNKNVVAHEFVAMIWLRKNNLQKARISALQAIKLNPTSARGHFVLGRIYLDQKQYVKARKAIQKAVKYTKDEELRKTASGTLKIIETEYDRTGRGKSDRDLSVAPAVDEQVEKNDSSGIELKPKIAVFPFEDSNVRTERLKFGETLSEMLITALIQTKKFEVIERLQLEKIIEEQKLGQSGALDDETAVEVGQLLGLDAIVIGSISRLKSVIEADVRFVDVKTGKALTAVNGRIHDVDQVRDLANQLASKLAANAHTISVATDSTKSPKIE